MCDLATLSCILFVYLVGFCSSLRVHQFYSEVFYTFFQNVLGKWSSKLFAIALLASGQSSTITGTYAGQYVMQVLFWFFFHVKDLLLFNFLTSGSHPYTLLVLVNWK